MRIMLVVGLVLAIMVYVSLLMADRGLRRDAFADLGERVNVFTLYYMNGCPHCESILPDFKKFAAAGQVQLNGKKVQLRMLEQSDITASIEMSQRNIKGFPTFILATPDGKHIEYQGERSVSAMKKFISENAI